MVCLYQECINTLTLLQHQQLSFPIVSSCTDQSDYYKPLLSHTHQIKKEAPCRPPPTMKMSPPIMMAGLRPVFSERAAKLAIKETFTNVVTVDSNSHANLCPFLLVIKNFRYKELILTDIIIIPVCCIRSRLYDSPLITYLLPGELQADNQWRKQTQSNPT